MINKRFDEIEPDDLEDLVTQSIPESRTLEYKESLPGTADGDKREFLADVTSFANAGGGDMVFGVRDKRDEQQKPTGTPEALVGVGAVNADAEVRRLDSICRDSVAPRINGLRVKALTTSSGAILILVRIPKSWSAPHMVVSSSRFFSRNSAGKYPLDVSEIRAAFALSDGLSERVRRFREDRLARIVADDTPVPLSEAARIVMHVAPLGAFEPGASVDVSRLAPVDMPPIYSDAGWSGRINFDGFLTYSQLANKTYHSYTQLFRSGSLEAVEAFLLRPRDGTNIASTAFERVLIKALNSYRLLLSSLQLDTPWFVMLALLGVRGYTMGVSSHLFVDQHPIDRDALVLSDLIIEDGATPSEHVLRPAFDAIWQSCGLSGSFNYDADGAWRPRS